ncbi:cbb3-type cytochrome c oxidase subunit 3 [Marinoscillum sp. 108]|jgi:cbb3-type cytochrome oxidase subunit 3|uniref:CcoQ/FixQ family Cbb3-type cytochrome c oxidase assembly chaperone n=1 Tax=Marinoscillum luteum TaxID=861051 RepID=A0ABW7NDX3_9BACT|nr:cbb3-type cytochrome c oxidase subunit 3 [Marinoscillum sp. 108]VXD14342.1 CcoQ/FixQ family Cbb3-type cytochrome c oxidase assembly chaperone [Marinoscillum sp. 108]
MLKFVKHHMETIAGIEVFPLISLIIFFVFFLGLFIYVLRSNRKQIDEISRIPLNINDESDELL